MSLFQIAVAGNSVSIESISTKAVVERDFAEVPSEVTQVLNHIFGTDDLTKPAWTRTGVMVAHSSPLYLWFLFCRAEDKYQAQEEPSMMRAMDVYADMVLNGSTETL